ncbi:DUF362 domain-containing protein [Candidatus Latescibacterota bacterium]
MKSIKRREFLEKMKRTAQTGSLIAGANYSDLMFPETTRAEEQVPDGMSVVGIAGSNDPEVSEPSPLDSLLSTEQVREIVWLALDRDTSTKSLLKIVTKDSWVVIKPNLVTCPVTMTDFHADGIEHWWLVTDLRVIKAVAEYLIMRIGPRRITIAEGPIWYSSGGKLSKDTFEDGWHCSWQGFGSLSYTGVVEEFNSRQDVTQVDIVDLNEDDAVYITDFDPYGTGTGAFQDVRPGDPDGTSGKEWTKRKGIYLPKTIMERDVLITVPVLKTHSSAGVTLNMKNFVGCIHSQTYGDGNSKKKIHQGSQFGLVRGIADLASAINPEYAVSEGFWATEQQHHGQNGVGLNHNVVVAGGDVVAAEAVSMMVMGYHPLDSDMLRMCHQKKLGNWHPDAIEISGPPYTELRRNFIRAVEMYFARGIRRWNVLGPLKSQVKDAAGLVPGDNSDKNAAGKETEWSVFDGDLVIDAGINTSTPFKLQDCLLYTLPNSVGARKGSVYYLALKIHTDRKDLIGQLLVGIDGADFRVFFNGREKEYRKEPLAYDPTPIPFLKILEGENTLVLEIKKSGRKKEEVRIAVNLCDLDGDRLADITMVPAGE